MQISRVTYSGPPARLQQRLDQGEVPQDLVLWQGERSHPLNPELAVKAGRSQFLQRALPLGAVMGMGGAAVGMLAGGALGSSNVLGPVGPFLPILAGMGVGAAAGVVVGIDQGKAFSGRVNINLDGHSRTETWKGEPQLRRHAPEEVKAMLTALGELGERIEPAEVKPAGTPDPERLAASNQARATFKELGAARRLVADLGEQSRYGKPALQLVDGQAARDLWVRGGKVYVVSGQGGQDRPHHLATTARTGARHQTTVDDYSWVDREFRYTLAPLTDVSGLDAPGTGLPEGLTGVYRDEPQISVVIKREHDLGRRTFLDKGEDRREERTEGSQLAPAPGAANRVAQVLQGMTRNSARPTAITGGILGACAARLAGIDPTVGIIAGAATGYLTARAALAAEPGTLQAKSSRAVMMTAGAALGVGLALSGNLQGALTVGLVGGTLSGAYMNARQGGPGRLLTEAGMIGGTVLGMAAGATGSPWLQVPLAGLGVVGGALLGRITTP